MTREIHYRVHGDHVEEVSELTAHRHRRLTIDEAGDVSIEHSDPRLAAHNIYMSAAEARLVVREIIRHRIRSLFGLR